jgi:hypothetical protein
VPAAGFNKACFGVVPEVDGAVMNFTWMVLGGLFFGVCRLPCQAENITMSPACRNRDPARAYFPTEFPGRWDVEIAFMSYRREEDEPPPVTY